MIAAVRHRCGWKYDGLLSLRYRVRMEETARYAAEHGYDSFTTSLLISPLSEP